MDALCAGVTFVALVTLFALDALRASVTFLAFVTLFTLDALCAGVTFFAFVSLFALDALCAGVTFVALVTLFALDALCAGVTFVAFVTLFALDALCAGVAFITLVALQALCGNAGIGLADPPVAVCADKGRETVYTILAVYTVFAVLTVYTVFAVLTVYAVFTILAVRAGRTSAAARADQRCKPFLLRADKAVFHRDVVGGKPHKAAGRAGSGTRLFNRGVKRSVGEQSLRNQLVCKCRLGPLDVGKQGIVGDRNGVAAPEIRDADRAVQNTDLSCQRERVVPGKIRFARIRIAERAEHQRQKRRRACIARAKLRLRDAVG